MRILYPFVVAVPSNPSIIKYVILPIERFSDVFFFFGEREIHPFLGPCCRSVPKSENMIGKTRSFAGLKKIPHQKSLLEKKARYFAVCILFLTWRTTGLRKTEFLTTDFEF